jgi:hypothetical protein
LSWHGLQLAFDEGRHVALVRHDVIRDRGLDHQPTLRAQPAQRLLGQLLRATDLPDAAPMAGMAVDDERWHGATTDPQKPPEGPAFGLGRPWMRFGGRGDLGLDFSDCSR